MINTDAIESAIGFAVTANEQLQALKENQIAGRCKDCNEWYYFENKFNDGLDEHGECKFFNEPMKAYCYCYYFENKLDKKGKPE